MKTHSYSKEQLVTLLQKWVQLNGYIPSKRQLNADKSMPSDMAYREAFGSWGKALIYCGYDVQKPHPSQQCLKAASDAKKGKIREQSCHWKGGRLKDTYGYILIWDSDKKKYVKEHRKIVENYIGRELLPSEDIHHKNGIKDDNRIENLEIMKKSEHTSFHAKQKKYVRHNAKKCIFPGCGIMTAGKYGLCRMHYKKQWGKIRNGTANSWIDFTNKEKKHTEATKNMLREKALKQPRYNGRFLGNIHDHPELLKESE